MKKKLLVLMTALSIVVSDAFTAERRRSSADSDTESSDTRGRRTRADLARHTAEQEAVLPAAEALPALPTPNALQQVATTVAVEAEEQEENCGVCHAPLNEQDESTGPVLNTDEAAQILTCSHTNFHANCLHRWLTTLQRDAFGFDPQLTKCPNCRAPRNHAYLPPVEHRPSAGNFLAAAHHGNIQEVGAHLAIGVDIEARGPENCSALHLATRQGHTNTVKLLLDRGANVNASTYNSATALHLAAGYNRIEIADLFLQRGANPLMRCAANQTALDVATTPTIRNMINFRIFSVFLRSLEYDDEAMLENLRVFITPNMYQRVLSGVDGAPNFGNTALRTARMLEFFAKFNDQESVQALLTRQGVNVNALDNANNSALHLAAKNGCRNAVIALLAHPNIDVKLQNNLGETALMLACKMNYDAYPDPDEESDESAIASSNVRIRNAIVRALLDHPNIRPLLKVIL